MLSKQEWLPIVRLSIKLRAFDEQNKEGSRSFLFKIFFGGDRFAEWQGEGVEGFILLFFLFFF